MVRKVASAKELSIANVDFKNPPEREAYLKRLQKKAGENIHAAVKKLRDAGIIDEQGKRIKKKLPADMQPGSRCQVPR